MGTTMRNEQGSVLIIAVIAMLIMGVLSVSFALLSNIETTIGFNYKLQAQAEALAEAGLERARDALRSAASEPCGFTRWTSSAAVAGCGAPIGPSLFTNQPLSPGQYSAVVDNDCWIDAAHALVPTAIQQTGCPTTTDTNEIAVITAWATAGTGRARARGILVIDNPWKHVCSSSSQDNPPGYCNEAANRNGNPTVIPADPNEYPGGPAAYNELPYPQLGCSGIDVTLHGETAANCPPGANYNGPGYPVGKRLVVQGDRSGGKQCDGGGLQYNGYFDCALTTPCPASICSPLGRRACVKALPVPDSRIGANYVAAVAPGVCAAAGATGMVFTSNLDLPANLGAPGDGRNIYMMNSEFTIQNRDLRGTVVVEGNGSGGCAGGRDLWHKNGARIWTEQTNTTNGQQVYGYPLAYLIYDPELPAPTANPLAQQDTCADMGSAAGTEIHGLIYSGGNVELNPIVVDGGVIAFQIQTQGSSSTYGYNSTYGNAAPPAGFPTGSGNQVVISRKSFIVCTTYANDSAGGTLCR